MRPIDRLIDVLGYRTQQDIATFVGTTQSSISQAFRSQDGDVQPSWLVRALLKRRINPEWVLTGNSSRFLVPAHDNITEQEREELSIFVQENLPEVIRHVGTQELIAELARRTAQIEQAGSNGSAITSTVHVCKDTATSNKKTCKAKIVHR